MVAAGEVDVDRQVQRDARLAMRGNGECILLGMGGGELAAAVAGAGDEACADGIGLGRQPERAERRERSLDPLRRHAGDKQVLPDRKTDLAVAEVARQCGEPAHLVRRHLADGQHHADEMQPRLLLRMHADMGAAVVGGTRGDRLRRDAVELAAKLLLGERDEFLHAEAVDDVFESRLVAVGAVAVVDEHPHHRIGDLGRILGPDHHAGLAREVAMPGDAAEREAIPDAGRDRLPFESCPLCDLDGLEADIVGVFQRRDRAGAVKGDVELARQTVERTVVEDVEVPLARIGARVDQLLRIDARGRGAGDVADVVGA